MRNPGQADDELSLSVSSAGVTLEQRGIVFRFDAAGRLTRLYDGDHIYYRGLDNTLLEKWWTDTCTDRSSVRIRQSRHVETPRREYLLRTAYDTATYHLQPLLNERADDFQPAEQESIRRVFQHSPETLQREQQTVRSIYEPIGVLPPDQYKAIVLQSTIGCPYDCAFCTLYRDTELVVRSVADFKAHAIAVKSFFGRGLQSRRSVFLGSADPLAAPRKELIGMMDVIAREFPKQRANGVSAFLTVQTATRSSPRKLELLSANGLDRVYIGVESGAEEILELLRKPQTPDEAKTGIERVKAAGLDVGIIVLAGVGGREISDRHFTRTSEFLGTLPLDEEDIVYVSPLVVDETADYPERLRDRSLTPLSQLEITTQAKRLHSRLAEQLAARVSRYHISEFTYF